MSRDSNRPASAAIMPLEDLRPSHAGSKVRVAGFLLAFDKETRLGLLSHRQQALLVDLSTCPETLVPQNKTKIMLIGDLESRDVADNDDDAAASLPQALQDPYPDYMAHVSPSLNLPLLLRATTLRECHGLDLDVWAGAARTESQARWDEFSQRSTVR